MVTPNKFLFIFVYIYLGKNSSLLKRLKPTSIKHIFKKESISSPKLERGTSSPKNPHTRSSYQGSTVFKYIVH